jgi:hypothetical protein
VTERPSLVSVSVVSGPTIVAAPISVAPRRVQPGSSLASASIVTSASIQVEAGSTTVTLHPPPRLGLDRGEVGAVVDAHRHRDVVGDMRGYRLALGAQGGEDVGQVVLALGVVIGEPGEGGGQRRRVEGVGAGVDLVDRQLLRAGVAGAGAFRLDHALDLAAGAADDAAVGAGIVELDRQHRRGRRGSLMGLEQPGDRLGGDQRHVAGEDEDRLGGLNQRRRRAHGAAGSVGLGLDDGLGLIGKPGGDVIARRDDHRDLTGARLERGEDRPGDHRPAADGVQHLRQRRAHAGTGTRRHDQDQGRTHRGIVVVNKRNPY